jgi:hypothetical protein
MNSQEIIENLKSQLSNLRFTPRDYSPHYDIKMKADAIKDVLWQLINELEKEGRTKRQINRFKSMSQDLFHTMNKEYKDCEYSYGRMNKPRAAKVRTTEYNSSVNKLISQIRRDLSFVDLWYNKLDEEE